MISALRAQLVVFLALLFISSADGGFLGFRSNDHTVEEGKNLRSQSLRSGNSVQRKLANSSCFKSIKWSTADGNILLNGAPFLIKGINWFGFETELHIVHGLWSGGSTMDDILDFCADQRFNAIRIPLSLKLALDPDIEIEVGECMECQTTSSYDALNMLMDKAAERGILILFDMHNLSDENMNELWYDEDYSEEDFIQGWTNIVRIFGGKPNFMGIDIMNEPHGAATWGMNLETDWDLGAARIAKAIKENVPSFDHLILVEGIASGGAPSPYPEYDSAYEKFWGSNLDGLYTTQVELGPELDHLLVYSSHLYGPSLYPHYAFSVPEFPNNMPGIWDKQVGFVEKMTKKPVIMGEWGGRNRGDDALLQAVWVKYMADNCISDSFYWALNPNSSDLKGVLKDDWSTADEGKLILMATAQPNPSYFTEPITDDRVCVNYGEFALGSTCSASNESTWLDIMPAVTSIILKLQYMLYKLGF